MAEPTDSLHVGPKELFAACLVLTLFGLALIGADRYEEAILLIPYLEGYLGMILYTFLAIIATVAAPLSTVPLLPIAATLWGPLMTALLSIFGWTTGAIIAFLIARKYGRPFVGKLINLSKTETIAKKLTGKSPFWSIVVIRVLLPVDVLSYAIGLFLPISLKTYIAATIVGITPFALIFSYTSELPIFVQTGVILAGFIVILVAFLRFQKQ